MKNLLLSLAVVFGAWAAVPTPHADALHLLSKWSKGGGGLGQGTRGRNHAAAPELDPNGAGTGLLLLLGGAAYFATRRRDEDE